MYINRGKYFNTQETAERHLEIQRKAAIKRLLKRGDTILSDWSYISHEPIWEHAPEGGYAYETNIYKWFVHLNIFTQQMIDDLSKLRNIDSDIEETLLKAMK